MATTRRSGSLTIVDLPTNPIDYKGGTVFPNGPRICQHRSGELGSPHIHSLT